MGDGIGRGTEKEELREMGDRNTETIHPVFIHETEGEK